jgi:outer membrane protein W
MKESFIAIFLVLTLAFAGYAQEYKKIKVGLGTGYAFADGRISKVIFTIEPAYRIKDNLAVGFRLESAIIERDVYGNTIGAEIDYSDIGSYTINGQYYFGGSRFRPFVGLGGGLYKLETVTSSANGRMIKKEGSKFGFYPRFGFDYRHFTLILDYNLVPNSSPFGDGVIFNNYLSIRFGFFLGGGKK